MASPKSAEERAAAKEAKKQAKAAKRAKREGALPAGSKQCDLCHQLKDMLIRCANLRLPIAVCSRQTLLDLSCRNQFNAELCTSSAVSNRLHRLRHSELLLLHQAGCFR